MPPKASRAASRASARSTPASTSSRSRWRGARRSAHAARIYFGLGAALGLDWIRGEIERLAVEGHWQAVARGTLREEPTCCSAASAEHVLAAAAAAATRRKRVAAWLRTGGAAFENLSRTVREMRATGSADFPTLSVALQAVRRLAER